MLVNKYRPIAFDQVVGNKDEVIKIIKSLDTGLACNRILLIGPSGVGKTTLARIIAMSILKKEDFEQIKNSFSYKEIDGGARGQIQKIREFVDDSAMRGFASDKRVVFFDECAGLSRSAQRALLKMIEDSKVDDYFIFATSEEEKIIEPLASRFVIRRLKAVSAEDTILHLTRIVENEGKVIDKKILLEFHEQSQGNLRRAEYLLEDYIASGCKEEKNLTDEKEIILTDSIAFDDDIENDDNIKCESQNLETHEGLFDYDNKFELINENGNNNNIAKQQFINKEPLVIRCDIDGVANSDNTEHENDKMLVAGIINNNKRLNAFYESIKRTACTSTDMLKINFPKPRSFMAPFINEGSLTMIYSVAGVGKSWFSLFNALALTRLNCQSFELSTFRVAEQCGVVIIDGEMPRYQLQQRLSSLSGPLGDENVQTPLTIITSESLVADVDQAIDLDNEDWRNSIYAYMENNPQNKVIILDNLSSLSGGGSESSREAIVPINRWLLSLKRLGVAVVLIHHSNRSGGYRGHSSQIDNLDTVINLTKIKKTDELCFKVDFIKARTAKAGDARSFVLEAAPHHDNPEWLTWNWYYEDDEELAPSKDDEIVAYLLGNNVTQREVANHFGVSQPKVSQCKRMAMTQGYLTEKGEMTEDGRRFIENRAVKATGDQGLASED